MLLPGLNSNEAKNLLLSVGTHRKKRLLSPVEVAILFQRAINNGASKETCAQFVHLNSPDMIVLFLKLLELSPLVQLSTDWGQTGSTISFTSARLLSALSKDEQEITCQEIMTNQLNKSEVIQVIQLRKRSGRNITECLNEVVGMRPIITKIHLIMGAITNPDVQESLLKFSQIERDTLFRSIISEIYSAGEKLSGRLGIKRFSISTDERGFNIISSKHGPSFEHVINQTLINKLVASNDK
ncbi:MAG: hypothetical protein KKI12_11440 [Proteobacteria bacterium]|nr:hypothetical protein [Pseudomonadota bacterium]MBU4259082.1 hypothetical protein [Pseudomonadota bacterium]MBU4288768.1 hypothetical protein [Pseudomonadota bacterium]